MDDVERMVGDYIEVARVATLEGRRALARFGAATVEALSATQAAEFLDHLAECDYMLHARLMDEVEARGKVSP